MLVGSKIFYSHEDYHAFRDYEVLNHRLLETLVEKVHALEENAGGRLALPYGMEESERSLMDYSWVFDDLADEVDSRMDPNYTLPPVRGARGRCTTSYVVAEEQVGENSITTSAGRKYNLRPRK
jgi:hypothetical protein